jgi:outer membrane receptor protein involved in Fe transport
MEASVGYKITPSSYADVVYYYSAYEGAIGTKTVPYLTGTTGQNQAIGSLRIQGVQASLNYSLANYSLAANYTYTYPLNRKLDAAGNLTDEYQRVGSIASNHFNFSVNARYFDRLNINLRAICVGKIPVGAGTTVADNPDSLREFPAYAVFNGAIGWYGLLPGLDVQLICDNILNKEYSSPGVRAADGLTYGYRAPQRERVFLLRLIYNLK